MRHIATIIVSFALLLGMTAVAAAQESRSEISLQGTGFFTKDTTGQGITQRSTNTGGFVFRVPAPARFRISPYVLAEGGALVFDPTGNTFGAVPGAQSQSTGVFVYGGGADFPIVRHVSLRAEYRGLVYSAPDFGLSSLNTNTINHTA